MSKILKFIKSEVGRFSIGALIFVCAIVLEAFQLSVPSLVLYALALIISGAAVYIDAVRGILRRDFLDEKFLMSVASVGAMLIGEYTEGVAVMLFFLLGEMFEHKAVAKSRSRIKALLDICPDEATVLRGGEELTVDADEVEVGDRILIRAGERVPVDSVVISGFADADTSALTGESVPKPLSEGSTVESGSIIIGGALECEALREASDSGAMRILDMVENATENKAREENFITAFSKIYTPIVVSLAVILAIVPSLIGITEWSDSVYRALIFLVISCPCALVISVPMAFFCGIGSAASRGILYKGGNSFSPVAKSKTVAFDKTGTLTSGEFTVKRVIPCEMSESELLGYAAAVEQYSNHPIAISVSRAVTKAAAASDVRELAGRGAVGCVDGKSVAVGNVLLMQEVGATVPESFTKSNNTLVYVAIDGVFSGVIEISDSIKKEAVKTIKMLRKVGISRVIILSGDKKSRAEIVGNELNVDEVKSELLPEEKYTAIKEEIVKSSGKVMYVGDGINDAPSLTLADVGVAMGGMGSDSAIECADLVITSDNLERLPEAILIARKTLRIAKQNIALALGVKLGIMALSAFGIANMWLAVFADVGVAVIAILNSMRNLIKRKATL